ncbi:MAG: YadA-like family protein [Moraxella sp.]|nr:YadA-like family protein [Moraxella sp.]
MPTTINNNGITINNGTAGSQVSLSKDGLNNGDNKITHVAKGEISASSTDAVNGSQLYAVNQQVIDNSTNIQNLGDQINHINSVINHNNQRMDKIDREAKAGIASAMAMEHAPFVAGKITYAVGAAQHGGEQAVGITFRKTSDNGRWSLSGGVATATEGEPSFRIGFSGVLD